MPSKISLASHESSLRGRGCVMRVGIVNDLPLAVELLRRLVSSSAEHKVAWIAMNGREAVDACRRDRPDLVLMDLNMPVMDGVEATRLIMAEAPCPILLVTASVDANVSGVYDAMGYGALDAVDIPAAGLNGEASVQGRALLARMAAIERLSRDETRGGQRPAPPPARSSARHPLIAIGASAGGPAAVAALLGALPPDFGAAIVLVQHLDAQFVPGFATWLGQQCSLPVRPAEAGDRPVAGAVLIAASGDHLVLGPNGELGYNEGHAIYRSGTGEVNKGAHPRAGSGAGAGESKGGCDLSAMGYAYLLRQTDGRQSAADPLSVYARSARP